MANLTITSEKYCPDSTYFTTGSVEPDLSGDALTVYNGNGSHRSWGAPGVTSTVALQDADLVAVHIGFHHKHRGGQFWRYYQLSDDGWSQVEWKDLADSERARILAALNKAPSWAKVPGKLRTECKAPSAATQTSYKIVRQRGDGSLVSVYDGETVYEIGKRLTERAVGNHGGGYYSYPNRYAMLRAFQDGDLFPDRCYEAGDTYALLEVEISGAVIAYGAKLASTHLRPVAVLDTFTWQHAYQEVC